tara:strand:- start:4256 stop:5533 length:1278 start_codon:yes stop_codon:yes gene_type:complete
MGWLSKAWKGIKTGVKGVVKGVKKAFKAVGKFMGKIGILGQIAMSFILPGLPDLMGMLAEGMINYTGIAAPIVNGAGKFINAAINVGSKVMKPVKSITQGVTDAITNTVGTVAESLRLDDAFNAVTGKNWSLDQYKLTNGQFADKMSKDVQKMFSGIREGFDFEGFNLNETYSQRQARLLKPKLKEADIFKPESKLEQVDIFKNPKLAEADIFTTPAKDFGTFLDETRANINTLETRVNSPSFNVSDEAYNAGQATISSLQGKAKFDVSDKIIEQANADGFDINHALGESDSILAKTEKNWAEKAGDYLVNVKNQITSTITDGKKTGEYLLGMGDEFLTTGVAQVASKGADKLVYGDRPDPKSYSFVMGDMPEMGTGADTTTDVLASAADYNRSMQNGGYWGATAVWDQWRHFMVGNEQQQGVPS